MEAGLTHSGSDVTQVFKPRGHYLRMDIAVKVIKQSRNFAFEGLIFREVGCSLYE
jgi:hypothetical protein